MILAAKDVSHAHARVVHGVREKERRGAIRAPYDEVADVVEDIVEAYLALRQRPDELFVDAVKRLGVEPFKERVYATR